MPWVKFAWDAKEAREFTEKFARKTKFYADEDIDDSIIYALRHEGYDVESARERGLLRHSDDFQFKRAAGHKRVLITHDKDYLDHERFPLSQTWGVFIIDVDRSDTGQLARALEVIHTILGDLALLWRESKIVIKSDYTLKLYTRRERYADEVFVVRCKLDTNGKDVWLWEDDS